MPRSSPSSYQSKRQTGNSVLQDDRIPLNIRLGIEILPKEGQENPGMAAWHRRRKGTDCYDGKLHWHKVECAFSWSALQQQPRQQRQQQEQERRQQ
jgi:hypothetical protein